MEGMHALFDAHTPTQGRRKRGGGGGQGGQGPPNFKNHTKSALFL